MALSHIWFKYLTLNCSFSSTYQIIHSRAASKLNSFYQKCLSSCSIKGFLSLATYWAFHNSSNLGHFHRFKRSLLQGRNYSSYSTWWYFHPVQNHGIHMLMILVGLPPSDTWDTPPDIYSLTWWYFHPTTKLQGLLSPHITYLTTRLPQPNWDLLNCALFQQFIYKVWLFI